MNVFDNSDAPHKIPRTLVRGDYVAWRNSLYVTDYPPADYQLILTARFEGDSSGEQVVIAAQDSGEFLFEIDGVDWELGTWFYDLHVRQISDDRRHTLKSGVIQVLADRAEDPNDPRAEPRKKLALLEALIKDRIENRQIDVTSFDNGETSATRDYNLLVQERRRLKHELRAASQRYRALRGLPHSGTVRLRG